MTRWFTARTMTYSETQSMAMAYGRDASTPRFCGIPFLSGISGTGVL